MKTLVSTLVLSLSMAGMSYAQTIIYSQDFNRSADGVMPNKIRIIEGDNCDIPSPNQARDFWSMIARNTQGDSCVVASSYFSQNPCMANDWLILDTLVRVGNNSMLKYEVATVLAADYQIYISTSGNTQADFLNTTPIVDKTNYNTQASFVRDSVGLLTYANQNVYLAFRYTSTNQYELYFDNIVVYNDTTVSVSRINKANFMLYPNPANTQLTVKLSSANEAVLRVYNALGQEVHQAMIQNGQLDMNTAQFVSGMYTISIQTGAQLQTERVLIQH